MMTFDKPLKPGESVVVEFDFSEEAAAIVSVQKIDVTVLWSGGTADPAPSALKSGSWQISGAKVLQRMAGGVHMNDYGLACWAVSDTGDILCVPAVLQVREPF